MNGWDEAALKESRENAEVINAKYNSCREENASLREAIRKKDEALKAGIRGCDCQHGIDVPLCEVCQMQKDALSLTPAASKTGE